MVPQVEVDLMIDKSNEINWIVKKEIIELIEKELLKEYISRLYSLQSTGSKDEIYHEDLC